MSRFECFECGTHATHAHHVVPSSLGGTRTIPLCHPCHGKVHGVLLDSGLLVRKALAEKRARNELAGAMPYGSRMARDGIHLEDDPREQMTIDAARRLRLCGMTLRAIARELNRLGMRSRNGRPFVSCQIFRMVRP